MRCCCESKVIGCASHGKSFYDDYLTYAPGELVNPSTGPAFEPFGYWVPNPPPIDPYMTGDAMQFQGGTTLGNRRAGTQIRRRVSFDPLFDGSLTWNIQVKDYGDNFYPGGLGSATALVVNVLGFNMSAVYTGSFAGWQFRGSFGLPSQLPMAEPTPDSLWEISIRKRGATQEIPGNTNDPNYYMPVWVSVVIDTESIVQDWPTFIRRNRSNWCTMLHWVESHNGQIDLWDLNIEPNKITIAYPGWVRDFTTLDVVAESPFIYGGTASSFAITSGSLPAGLSLHGTTGVISGTPTTASTNGEFTVTATDSDGETGSAGYYWSVS